MDNYNVSKDDYDQIQRVIREEQERLNAKFEEDVNWQLFSILDERDDLNAWSYGGTVQHDEEEV